jgi:hypothetical protein
MILSAKLPLKYRLQDFVLSAAARCTTHFELSIRSGGCGFFGDVAMALNGLRFAENMARMFGIIISKNPHFLFRASRRVRASLRFPIDLLPKSMNAMKV